MKLDRKGCAVNYPESRGPRVFRIGEGNDEMGRVGVIRTLDVGLRGFSRPMRMRMINREEVFARIPEFAQNLEQFSRIHVELRGGRGDVFHRDETLDDVAPGE